MMLYKIRDKRTGMYSRGGADVKRLGEDTEHRLYARAFNKNGKSWPNISAVKLHLKMFKELPEHWEVVFLEAKEIETQPVEEFI